MQLAQFCDTGYQWEYPLEFLPITVAKWLERQTLVNMVWGSNPPGGDISQHDAGKFGNLLWVRYAHSW